MSPGCPGSQEHPTSFHRPRLGPIKGSIMWQAYDLDTVACSPWGSNPDNQRYHPLTLPRMLRYHWARHFDWNRKLVCLYGWGRSIVTGGLGMWRIESEGGFSFGLCLSKVFFMWCMVLHSPLSINIFQVIFRTLVCVKLT